MTSNMTLKVTSTSEPTVNSRVVSFCLQNIEIILYSIDNACHGNTNDEDDDEDLSGGGDEADCVDARSSSWYQGSRSVTFDYMLIMLPTCVQTPVPKKLL